MPEVRDEAVPTFSLVCALPPSLVTFLVGGRSSASGLVEDADPRGRFRLEDLTYLLRGGLST